MVVTSLYDIFITNLPILAATVTGLAILLTYFLNHRKDEKSKDITLLINFTKEFTKLYSTGLEIEYLEENKNIKVISRKAARYSRDYLNVLSKICYLTEIGYMKKEIGEYFEWAFNYGLTLKTWMIKRGMADHEFERHWVTLDAVFNKKSKKLKLKEIRLMSVDTLPDPFKTLNDHNYPVFSSEDP